MGSQPNSNPNPPQTDGKGSSAPPPYQPRSTTRRQGQTPNPRPRRPTYYQPQVHQFTCRGAFHLKKDFDINNQQMDAPTSISKARESEQQSRDYLEDMLKDTFVCNGIQTRLKHVADYPLARTKDEAIHWFQGVDGQIAMDTPFNNAGNKNDKTNNNNSSAKNKKKKEEETKVVSTDDADSFSSYGTTQVNILTLQEVPGLSPEETQLNMMDDPFSGFGALPPSGIFNPFGSIFGGFFGGGFGGHPFDPELQQPQGADGQPANNNGWMRGGSRSVKSSTRTHRDENGKRVVTTVTETTIVDSDGKRKTETETTVRHLDDGGRVETKKEIHTDGDDGSQSNTSKNSPKAPRVAPSAPSFPHPTVVAPAGPPTSPPEVAVIDTETLFGVAITDAAGQHPDDADYQPSQRGTDSGWRRTEFLFRLGRFIPPFMVVSQYYNDKEGDAKRKKAEYDKMRQRMKKERYDKAKGRGKDNDDGIADSTNDSEEANPNSLPNYPSSLSSYTRSREIFQKVGDQMEKNLKMMQIIGKEMIKPDFPSKVQKSGEKIIDNFGPTAERVQKLAKDVVEMWSGWSWDGDGNGRRR